MTIRKALITGISGQDGSYLAELLLSKGYEVHGMIRRTSSMARGRIDHLAMDKTIKDKTLFLHYGDMTDGSNISRLIEKIMPDYIVNMAAQSHVKISFDVPEYSAQVDAIGLLRLLDAIKEIKPDAKLLHASTSECFGKVQEIPQTETTPFHPQSPYAAAKVFAHHICRIYREAYGLFVCNSICFNHEGPRRGENFVTRKITMSAAKIVSGQQEKVSLGNLSALRDWGYAKEYCEAMLMILGAPIPDDYIIATGENHSVEEFCELAFARVGMPLTFRGEGLERKGYDFDNNIRVDVNPKFFRPAEVETLLGDPSKIYKKLGWKSKTSFKQLVYLMADYDLKQLGQEQ